MRQVYIVALYLGKHLLFMLKKMPMYIGSCKEIFCNRAINLIADFVIYAHLRSCNHLEHKCHNNLLMYLLHNGASNSNIFVNNTLQILKFHMFFNNINSLQFLYWVRLRPA